MKIPPTPVPTGGCPAVPPWQKCDPELQEGTPSPSIGAVQGTCCSPLAEERCSHACSRLWLCSGEEGGQHPSPPHLRGLSGCQGWMHGGSGADPTEGGLARPTPCFAQEALLWHRQVQGQLLHLKSGHKPLLHSAKPWLFCLHRCPLGTFYIHIWIKWFFFFFTIRYKKRKCTSLLSLSLYETGRVDSLSVI